MGRLRCRLAFAILQCCHVPARKQYMRAESHYRLIFLLINCYCMLLFMSEIISMPLIRVLLVLNSILT